MENFCIGGNAIKSAILKYWCILIKIIWFFLVDFEEEIFLQNLFKLNIKDFKSWKPNGQQNGLHFLFNFTS